MPDINPEQDVKAGPGSKEVMLLRKRAGVPEVDPDGLPSAVAGKMISCMTKRKKMMSAISELFGQIKKPTEIQQKTLS